MMAWDCIFGQYAKLVVQSSFCLNFSTEYAGDAVCNASCSLWAKKEQDAKLLSVTSPNIDQFSKFFHCYIQQIIHNKIIVKDPTIS